MLRTQIYLTESEHEALDGLSRRSGKKKSQLIREAVDQYVAQTSVSNRKAILKACAGMWAHRTDLPDFEKLRKEWDRPLGRR